MLGGVWATTTTTTTSQAQHNLECRNCPGSRAQSAAVCPRQLPRHHGPGPQLGAPLQQGQGPAGHRGLGPRPQARGQADHGSRRDGTATVLTGQITAATFD